MWDAWEQSDSGYILKEKKKGFFHGLDMEFEQQYEASETARFGAEQLDWECQSLRWRSLTFSRFGTGRVLAWVQLRLGHTTFEMSIGLYVKPLSEQINLTLECR